MHGIELHDSLQAPEARPNSQVSLVIYRDIAMGHTTCAYVRDVRVLRTVKMIVYRRLIIDYVLV